MKGWKIKSLGEISEVQSGGTPLKSQKEYWFGDIPWYSSGELNELFTHASKSFITRKGLEKSNAKLFPKGSLLIGMYDTAALKMSILDRDAAFNQAIAGVKPNEGIDLKFIFYAINSRKPKILNQRRGVRQRNLSLTKIKNIILPFPPLSEQKRIVAILDEAFEGIDAAIANTEKNLANARELFESYLNGIFTRKGEGWENSIIEKNIKFIDYRGRTPTKTEHGMRLITAKNVKMGFLQVEPKEYVDPDIYDSWMTRGIPKKGDVLFTTEAPLGNVAQLHTEEKVVFAQRIIIMQPNSKFLDSTFLKFLLMSKVVQNRIQEKGTGATAKGIKSSLLKKINISFPSSTELQKQIAANITELQSETQRLESIYQRKLKALKELKQSILEKAFTGELTGDVAKEVANTSKEIAA
jgi:type I restriction enzyme S subunit